MNYRIGTWATPLIMAIGSVLLLVLAVFLINREDASSIANAAETAMVADNALGVVTAIRTATTYSRALGDSPPEETGLDFTSEIDDAVEELESRITRLVGVLDKPASTRISDSLRDFVSSTQAISDAIPGTPVSDRLLEDQSLSMGQLIDELVDVRDQNVELVLVAGEDVGRAATAVRFLVLFVIPLAVILSLWRIQRRFSEKRVLAAEVEKQTHIAQSKDAFVADVSHELRTPLTGIYGFAMTLEEQSTNLNEFQAELLSLIITESAELTRMVDDLVAIGRIDANAVTYSMDVVDIEESIQQVIKPFQRMGVSFEYDNEGLQVYADEARFRQILRNLLSNAVRYGRGDIAVAAFADGSNTTIEVIDDGPGVPSEVTERLFERYVHDPGSGVVEGSVGLGLAIAHSFAKGMGGSLTYQRVDDLTVFQLTLPSHAPADMSPNLPRPDSDLTATSVPTVAI